MEIDYRALKRQARQAMRQTHPNSWIVTLTYLLITTGFSLLLDLIPVPAAKSGISTPIIFLNILYWLYAMVVAFGFTLWCLWTARKLDPGLGSLAQGFSVVWKVVLMDLGILLRTALWCLAVSLCVSLLMMPLLNPFAIVAAAVAVPVTAYIAFLRYSLAPYFLADDPDAGSTAAISRSAAAMRGFKFQLFKLDLSFLGWELLSSVLASAVVSIFLYRSGLVPPLTADFGTWQQVIGSVNGSLAVGFGTALATLPIRLWVLPYHGVSRALFYNARLQFRREDSAAA